MNDSEHKACHTLVWNVAKPLRQVLVKNVLQTSSKHGLHSSHSDCKEALHCSSASCSFSVTSWASCAAPWWKRGTTTLLVFQ